MKEWVTSDWHFSHNNICGPEGFVSTRKHFANAEEMNETIIANHNAVVSVEDRTYHLGDLAINAKPQTVHEILCRLNGSMIFDYGNHDNSRLMKYLMANNFELPCGRMKYEAFHEVGFKIKANKKVYYLTHYPLGLGEGRAIYRNLCGHIHDETTREANMLNVGVDSPELPERPFGQPILLGEAFALVDAKWLAWKEKMDRLIATD